MRIFSKLLLCLALLAPFAHSTDRYYAPSAVGAGDRSNCSNAAALTGTLSLSAGDIAHLCAGSYTGSSASTLFTVAANGTLGNVITVVADQGSAVLSAPYWGTNVVGAIDLTGNFITLDGGNVGQYLITNSVQSGSTATFTYTKTGGADVVAGRLITIAGTSNGAYKFNGLFTVATATSSQFTVTFPSATVGSAAEKAQAVINNLVIENTLNGTPSGTCLGGTCTQQQASLGIAVTGSNDTVKNTTITHIFVHTEGETNAETDDQNTAIETEGSGNLITRNTIDNVYNGISYSPANGSTGEEISWNTIELCNHCITVASDTESFSGVVIRFNDISSMFNWDTPTNRYHHNGVFEFTNGTITGTILNANFIHGMMSRDAVYGATHVTGWVFIEFCNPGLQMYNNILEADADAGGTPLNYPANGYITAGTNCGGATQGFYNNTILGHADSGSCYSGGSSGMDFRDNLIIECGNPEFNATASSPFTQDYNTWYWSVTSGDIWQNGAAGATYPNIAAWRTSSGQEAHSQAQVDPKISTTPPFTIGSGSSAISAGLNLSSLSIASLTTGAPQVFGAAGFCGTGCLTRPGSGAWDAGAYPFSSASSVANTPTFSPVAGTYSGAQSVTISTTSIGAIICYSTTATPATNGTTGCTTGTLYVSPVAIVATSTLQAVAGGTGYTDSSVGSAAYTINNPAPAPYPAILAGLYGTR